jgi:hypothetical protein
MQAPDNLELQDLLSMYNTAEAHLFISKEALKAVKRVIEDRAGECYIFPWTAHRSTISSSLSS